MLTVKTALTATAISVSGSLLLITPASADQTSPRAGTLVELFTSQGCSSCPPANDLVGTIANREGVVVLTFPVDYWDRLGWKDPFGSPAYTERQRAYAQTRGDSQVYTPQVVVNGLVHAVGSQPGAVDAAITNTTSAVEPQRPKFDVTIKQGVVSVATGDAPAGGIAALKNATVWLAEYRRTATTSVKRGENAGADLTYTNIVRRMTRLGDWNGKANTVSVNLKGQVKGDGDGRYDGAVVFLQKDSSGPVLAAVELPTLTDLK
jgi:hypothetical protein